VRAGTQVFQSERKALTTRSGQKIEADAGRLMVPENRSNPRSRSIAIEFLRLRSRSASPRAPLFYLEGGPGSRAISERPDALEFWNPFLDVCDVVLINQRGTNDPALIWNWDGPPPVSYFLSADSAARHEAEMDRRSVAAFRARGVDLAGYTSVESAADLDALRATLGIPRVSLLGFSYGTHLECAYLRKYGDHVENAVMLGVEGPDQTQKLPWVMDVQLRKLGVLVARDPRLSSRIPDLVALFDRVIARLERQPAIIPVAGPSGDTLRVPIGPFGLRMIMRFDMGDATDLVVFPRLLWSIDQGDLSVLAWFVRKRVAVTMGVHGMSESMDTASGITQGRLALIQDQSRTSRFGDVVNFPFLVAGASWPVPDLGDAFRAPLVSSVRALIVSGLLDFNTPPAQGDELAWGLPNATHLVVANAGHEQTWFQNDTTVPVIKDFLLGQDVSARRITYPALRFVSLDGDSSRMGHPSVAR
jgi:pimeloyl-ACP methyl ester carboxylesterase